MGREQWRPSSVTLPESGLKEKVVNPDVLLRFDRIIYAFGTHASKAAFFLFGLTLEPSTPINIYKRTQQAIPNIWLPHLTMLLGDIWV